MGQFSWRCADTKNALLDSGIEPQKNCTTKAYLLIPKEFGGGYFFVDNTIRGREYDGYGNFFDEQERSTMPTRNSPSGTACFQKGTSQRTVTWFNRLVATLSRSITLPKTRMFPPIRMETTTHPKS